MSFDTDGFFSHEMDGFRDSVKAEEPSKAWFAFALELNRAMHEVLHHLPVPQPEDKAALTLAALLIRTIQSYQAALILAEREMTGDARAVLRTAIEGVVTIHALAASPKFLDCLEGQNQANQRMLAKVVSEAPDLMCGYPRGDRERIGPLGREKRDKSKEINWGAVAAKYRLDVYPLLYRTLSIGGTHTNIDSVGRHLEKDADGHPVGLRGGPDGEGIVPVLRIATEVAFLAVEPFVKLAPTKCFAPRFQSLQDRWSALPGE